jgi:hypothetical protein
VLSTRDSVGILDQIADLNLVSFFVDCCLKLLVIGLFVSVLATPDSLAEADTSGDAVR